IAVAQQAVTTSGDAGSGATIPTDKPDYSPGETAHIAGAGFVPREAATLQVLHGDAEQVPDTTNPQTHEPQDVAADDDGNVSAQWCVDPGGSADRAFRLTADSASGLHAETTFTDDACTVGQTGPCQGEGQTCGFCNGVDKNCHPKAAGTVCRAAA